MTPQQIEQMRINSCRKGLTMYGEYAAGAMDASEWQRKKDINNALTFLRIYGEGDFSCWEEFESVFRKAMEGEE